jgi:cytochrome P450
LLTIGSGQAQEFEVMQVPTGLEMTVFDEIFRNRPAERFAALRAADPVHTDHMLGRVLLTRAADVAAVLKDRSLSVDQSNAAPDTIVQRLTSLQDREAPRSMLVLDDPDHARLRRLVTHAFNARAIDAIKPRVAEVADELLDAVMDQDQFDLIEAYERAIAEIAAVAAEVNASVENIGARRLATVLERLLDEISFTAPDRSGEVVRLTAADVHERVGALAP